MVQIFMRDLKKVSALWSVHFKVSAWERFCYKGFLRNLSGAKCFVHLRGVSALEDVRFREVPLYGVFSVPYLDTFHSVIGFNLVTFCNLVILKHLSLTMGYFWVFYMGYFALLELINRFFPL